MGPKHDTSGTVQRLIALTLRPVSAWEKGRNLVAILGGLVVGGSYLGVSYSPTAGVAFVLAVTALLLAIALWRTDQELTALELVEPLIELDSPQINNGPAGLGVEVHDGQRLLFRASFVLLPIRNVKRTGFSRGETAMNLHGSIWLERADGTKLDGPRPVRWQEKQEQIARTGPPTAAEVAEIDIPPNGRPCIADAILQDRSESGIRIWSQDGLRHPLIQESCKLLLS